MQQDDKRIEDRIRNIEIMLSENKTLMMKMLHNHNEFAKALGYVSMVMDDLMIDANADIIPPSSTQKSKTPIHIKDYLEMMQFIASKINDIQELEDELEKHGNIIPGQLGEA
jgi:hypothetical protein